MKIVLTGGGSGGHFYPLIAVAEAINQVAKEKKLVDVRLYYYGDRQYNPKLLFDNGIEFRRVITGKYRRYFSILNIIDAIKTVIALPTVLISLFNLYPDIIFSKGSYVSFPVLFAARLLKIPVLIHESDSVPGKTSLWASKFAKGIALSYPQAASYFSEKARSKIVLTGNPIRHGVIKPLKAGAIEFLDLENAVPTILILGGSQGSELINETILDALPDLIKTVQIIHQTGPTNFKEVKQTAEVILRDNPLKKRYKPFDYLNDLALRLAAGVSDIVISRAGSAIFEIAAWEVPSIIIPITKSNGDHQRQNALQYAKAGACVVIEEVNLTAHVLISEINRLLQHPNIRMDMSNAAKMFAKTEAAHKIAEQLVHIAVEHER